MLGAAKHLDSVMRKGQGSLDQARFEHSLDEIVSLVKYTKDKDVFKEFYMTQLAKRLLLSKSASNEEELSMVKKLKTGEIA
jgi:cullin 4